MSNRDKAMKLEVWADRCRARGQYEIAATYENRAAKYWGRV